jgi:hypothetical protein
MAKQEVIEQARARLEKAGQMLNSQGQTPPAPGMATALALCGIYELLIEWADDFGESGGEPEPYDVLQSVPE